MSEQKKTVAKEDENKYTLQRPITFEGQEIKELHFDFDKLNGTELLVCVKVARQIDPEESLAAPIRAFTMSYQIAVAAAAAGVTADHIQALKGADFMQATQLAANFLMGRG
ncbi:phage tail assembly protein [Paenibacillus bouchesdurhonensis]|uniref:phage tail assembly protein n=1 Tax=Paenibacillus bouchesdurhonensis TaxID=1870990 RepID=UPI000DA639FD|nr:phage tail assembly protein [Paenibacillus bouchesdurhonensis]